MSLMVNTIMLNVVLNVHGKVSSDNVIFLVLHVSTWIQINSHTISYTLTVLDSRVSLFMLAQYKAHFTLINDKTKNSDDIVTNYNNMKPLCYLLMFLSFQLSINSLVVPYELRCIVNLARIISTIVQIK